MFAACQPLAPSVAGLPESVRQTVPGLIRYQ
jgi:hypothetical protein